MVEVELGVGSRGWWWWWDGEMGVKVEERDEGGGLHGTGERDVD